jgi:hypothetical protein
VTHRVNFGMGWDTETRETLRRKSIQNQRSLYVHRSLTVAAPFRVGAATVRERWIWAIF